MLKVDFVTIADRSTKLSAPHRQLQKGMGAAWASGAKAPGHANRRSFSSRVETRLRSTAQGVEHPGMPLISVVEGRQVFRRIERDLGNVDARVYGGFRHWGRGQHPSPEKAGRDDERGC